MTYTSVNHCGNEHAAWLKSTDFYKKEFDLLDRRLLEISSKNSHQETMEGVEHFQNQFVIQRNQIDELNHRIHEHEGMVATDVIEHAGKIALSVTADHDLLRNDFNHLEKTINELRLEFNRFLSKWM